MVVSFRTATAALRCRRAFWLVDDVDAEEARRAAGAFGERGDGASGAFVLFTVFMRAIPVDGARGVPHGSQRVRERSVGT
jgi:hypothetical protein